MTKPINGNLTEPVAVNTRDMDWSPSPSGSVWRKRVHLVGAPEAGQVTSVVRYDQDSSFPRHDHPGGEEILVLEGVFSDQQGDWPAGSYLLNPEGYQHAPFSNSGCVIFVKLRQYPGKGRAHIAMSTFDGRWDRADSEGCRSQLLYSQAGYADTMRVVQWPRGYGDRQITWPHGAEFFLLKGSFRDEHGTHTRGCWLRLPPGAVHTPTIDSGCEFYIKECGFEYLEPG